MCWKDRLRYPNYRAPQGRGFWSGNTTLDSEHPPWRHCAVLSMFLSLQRSRCDSPKACSSSEGPGQDTASGQRAQLWLLLWERGFTAAPPGRYRVLGPVVWGPGLLLSGSVVAEGHELFSLLRKQWRGKLWFHQRWTLSCSRVVRMEGTGGRGLVFLLLSFVSRW